MDTVSMYISVKAFDETDDGYLVMQVRVPSERVKYMVQGHIITLSTGTPAVLLGVGSTHEKAVARHKAYCAHLERMERHHSLNITKTI